MGPLADTGMTVPLSVGLPPPEDRGFADVWSALGGELKPSLDVVVIAPLDIGVGFPAGPPVEEGMVVDLSDLVDGGRDGHRQQRSLAAVPTAPAEADQTSAPAPRRRGRRSGVSPTDGIPEQRRDGGGSP